MSAETNSQKLDRLLSENKIIPILRTVPDRIDIIRTKSSDPIEIVYNKSPKVSAGHKNDAPPSKWFYEFHCFPVNTNQILRNKVREFDLYIGDSKESVKCHVDSYSPLVVTVKD